MESIIKPLLDATIKSVEASDPTAELQAQIDNATDVSQLTLNHLAIGNKGLNPAQVRALPESEAGIRIVLNNKPATINLSLIHI